MYSASIPPQSTSATPQPTPTPNMPQPAELPEGDLVTLNVGGLKFETRKSTLKFCDYFANMFSGRWTLELLPDGSVPIDADPEIFSILLAYIRRPTVYPLLWTKEQGFDYATYNRLLAEAKFFGLEALRSWIHKQKYLSAIKTSYKIYVSPACTGTWFSSLPADPPVIGFNNHAGYYKPISNIEVLQSFDLGVPGRGRCIGSKSYKDDPYNDAETFSMEYKPRQRGTHTEIRRPQYERLERSIASLWRSVEFHPEALMAGHGEGR
ncbi:hypothetical protein N0V83_006736 [Neocucurbitaria cava]|uniref:BTB domain-containing protein n=1 Tax=Neocucurbitaria cava TaxID=798079 RepID=A0A9W8Y854_9PLEO|nr:hypothetical protein N0V83_006736 [Neocucurbitaria cava]